jgi:hypothetical protein
VAGLRAATSFNLLRKGHSVASSVAAARAITASSGLSRVIHSHRGRYDCHCALERLNRYAGVANLIHFAASNAVPTVESPGPTLMDGARAVSFTAAAAADCAFVTALSNVAGEHRGGNPG